MKTLLKKRQLLMGAALGAGLVLPLAIVVACGGSSASPAPTTPTPTPETPTPETPTPETPKPEIPVVDPAEVAAQKSISDAPDSAPSGATLATRILVGLKGAVTKLATTAKVEVPAYLLANKPSFANAGAEAYLPILAAELQVAYGLPATTSFTVTNLARLITALGANQDGLIAAMQKVAVDFDGTKIAATSSWAAQIKFWEYLLNPANNYAHLKALLRTDDALTEAMIANFETVMTAPQGAPSGIKGVIAPNAELLGLGGTTRIFGTLPTTIIPSDYLARNESEIRKGIFFGGERNFYRIYLDRFNNVFEFNLALGYIFNTKTTTSVPLASFWRAKDWVAFADFLAKGDYVHNYQYSYNGRITSVAFVFSLSETLQQANNALIAALRNSAATPQIELIEATDYTPAALSKFSEDTLTDAGYSKVKAYLDIWATKPLWQALTKANSEYTSRVLGMLAGLSAEQFTALGNWMDALYNTLQEFFRSFAELKNHSAPTLFARSLAINLWDTTAFTSEPSQAKITDNNYANFFMQVFTRHFNGPKYVTPELVAN